ncbi:PREDICTED: DNA primase small subunit [Nicrophorus vespilloides]|uniref:DNA primase n=1 Tax=Nicrophorus vespilloides TaxID=110193 RepID=A0ABM1M3D6_NICVS|nr:PREDICTED: DNA primase small subunit [Nicrophorus vespilloides]
MGEYTEELLQELLPLFYSRLFPCNSFYRWLSYGSSATFKLRELSFTLLGDIYIRYQSFESMENFSNELNKHKPIKIDIGAIYNHPPKYKTQIQKFGPVEKELVFDIDMTDYDDVRTCCSGTDICSKCWKFMVLACKVLDAALREDFGFKHMLWVFSGRRGVHCWVCDENVKKFTDEERKAVAEYLFVKKDGHKNILFGDKIHTSLRRALTIIKPYFNQMMFVEQNILGTDEGIKKFLKNIHEEIRIQSEEVLRSVEGSEARWKVFCDYFRTLSQKQSIPKIYKNTIEELMLLYCYPRLDINVSKGINHLLKAPFCVHPKTGKVCIPFNPKTVDKFDPATVPTLTLLVDEINKYDQITKEEEMADGVNSSKIKDYKKTSLLKSITVFEDFLRNIERELKQKRKPTPMEF